MTLKIPPPPTLSSEYQQLNRWLLEIQSILSNSGGIDPNSIDGLPALITQVAVLSVTVAANTAAITALNASVAAIGAQVITNTANIATNTANIATNTADITTLQGQVTTLLARNQILNGNGVPAAGLGNNGDLYINNTGGAGTNLYGKRGGAWVAFA